MIIFHGVNPAIIKCPFLDGLGMQRLYSKHRGVAQLAARCVWDAEAGGSSPPTPTFSQNTRGRRFPFSWLRHFFFYRRAQASLTFNFVTLKGGLQGRPKIIAQAGRRFPFSWLRHFFFYRRAQAGLSFNFVTLKGDLQDRSTKSRKQYSSASCGRLMGQKNTDFLI